MSKAEQVLVGRTLNAVEIAEDKGAIRFRTDEGDVVARCDGDCCSYTWIEGIELPPLPAKVTAVENIDMPDADHPEDADKECVEYYGLKVTTDKGHLVLDYRNESNGYYGGSLSWPDDRYFYGGVDGQNGGTAWVSTPSEGVDTE